MSHYKSNVRDLEFNLFEVFGAGERMGSGPYAEMDVDTAREILHEVDRLATGPLAESFADADRHPPEPGAQEAMALLDRWGVGVSHVIGLGGRDLNEDIGGRMARQAIMYERRRPIRLRYWT